MEIKELPGIISEQNRLNRGAFKRGKAMGRDETLAEVIHDLDLILSLQTELEVRKELRELLKHYRGME